jgi:hypothetical protein
VPAPVCDQSCGGVGPGGVRVGHDDVGRNHLAGHQPDTADAPLHEDDLLDLRAASKRSIQVVDQSRQAALPIRDERVDGARSERIAANQQRMKAEGDTLTFIFDGAADLGMDASIARRAKFDDRITIFWAHNCRRIRPTPAAADCGRNWV